MEIKKSIILAIIIFIFFLSGCAYTSYLKDSFENIPNFHQVSPNLYRGGRPNIDGLKQLKAMGIKTLVSLRSNDNRTFAEKHLAKQHRLDFVNIPLSIYRQPTDDQVLEFLEVVTDKTRQPVFVYCESGRDRTGAMIATYRVIVEGWTIKEAYKEAKGLGFWPYRGTAELKKFIHQLKDKPQYFEAVGRTPPKP